MQPYEKYSHMTCMSQPQNFSISGLNQNCENLSCQCVYGVPGQGPRLTSTATIATKKSFSIDSILGTRNENKESFTPCSNPIMQRTPVSEPGSAERDRTFYEFPLVPSFGQYGNLGFPDFLTSDGANLLTANEARDWFDKPKRMRTIFTVDQLERLEEEFVRQQYMVGTERYYLAMELGLTETQVKVWFQNRRIKWRKQILEKQQKKYPRA